MKGEVLPITVEHLEEYASFRRSMWPINSSAGHWEAKHAKYDLNPLSTLCPGSGLYGYFHEGRLIGTTGAYPMPVSLDSEVFPGHMLVDQATLPKFRSEPALAALFMEFMRLPGMKFASCGAESLQRAWARFGQKIESTAVISVISPLGALIARGMEMHRTALAAPIGLDNLPSEFEVRAESPTGLEGFPPSDPAGVAWVRRGPDYWTVYCAARAYNGALALRAESQGAGAQVVMNILQSGRLRFGNLLDFRVHPGNVVAARRVAKVVRRFLCALRVCTLSGTVADGVTEAFLSAVGVWSQSRPTHWWALPKAGDPFISDKVRWRLSGADRDSHWGGLELHTIEESSRVRPTRDRANR